MDEAARLLHMSGRLIEISKIFLSLSAGAILLIATLLRNPPQIKRANWHVFIGLVCFAFCLMFAMLTIVTIYTFEGRVLREAQEVKLRAKSDTSEAGKPASAEPRAEPETQGNEKETEKQAETSSDQILADVRRNLMVTLFLFGAGLMSMVSFGMRIASSWEDKPAPSS